MKSKADILLYDLQSSLCFLLQYPYLEARGTIPEALKKALIAFESVSTFLVFTFARRGFNKDSLRDHRSRNPTLKILLYWGQSERSKNQRKRSKNKLKLSAFILVENKTTDFSVSYDQCGKKNRK